MIPTFACVAAALLVVVGCAARSGSGESRAYTVERDVTFTPDGWPEPLAADVYSPRGDGPFAAALLVHGGSWSGRSRSDMSRLAARLAERGFVAVNVSYRFAPTYRFPAQLDDVREALRWVHANAERLGIDRDRVGAAGYSAGAHLVALLATVSPGDELDRGRNGSQMIRPRAIVAGGTPTDLRKFKGGRVVPQFLGATQQQNPSLFALASPVVHVTPDDPPMFLYHGSRDRLVDPSHARDMKQALDSAGVRSELRIVPGLGHTTTFVLSRSTQEAALEFLERELATRDSTS